MYTTYKSFRRQCTMTTSAVSTVTVFQARETCGGGRPSRPYSPRASGEKAGKSTQGACQRKPRRSGGLPSSPPPSPRAGQAPPLSVTKYETLRRFAKEVPKDVETAGAVQTSLAEAREAANADEGAGATPRAEADAHTPAALSIVVEHDGEAAQDAETLVDAHSAAPSASADAAPSKASSAAKTLPTPEGVPPGAQTQIPASPSASLPTPADIPTLESTATPTGATEYLTDSHESDAVADTRPRPTTPPTPPLPLPPPRLASPAASSPTTEAAPRTPDAPSFAVPSLALAVEAEHAKDASGMVASPREEVREDEEEAARGALQPARAAEGTAVPAVELPDFSTPGVEDAAAGGGEPPRRTDAADGVAHAPAADPRAGDSRTPPHRASYDATPPGSVHGVQSEADDDRDDTTEATTGAHTEPYDSHQQNNRVHAWRCSSVAMRGAGCKRSSCAARPCGTM